MTEGGPGPAERRREFLYHVLPAWISAVSGLLVVAFTAYTLLAVHSTEGKVDDIMTHMGIRPGTK